MHDHDSSECYLIDLHDDMRTPRLVAAREPAVHILRGTSRGDWLSIRTNADGAEDFKIVRHAARGVRDARTGAMWSRIGAARYILSRCGPVDLAPCRLEREDSLPRIVVRQLAMARSTRSLSTRRPIRSAVHGGYEFDTEILRFTYSSMTTPARGLRLRHGTRARALRKRQEMPSRPRSARYVTRRLMAKAAGRRDGPDLDSGATITRLDGTAPLLLYGYGAYGIAMPAAFIDQRAFAGRSRLRLRDRACPRRHRQGLALVRERQAANKPNTFTDFIAAARTCRATGYAAPSRIVAHGGWPAAC